MDPLKRIVANAVWHAVNGAAVEIASESDKADRVTVSRPTDLVTQVRVVTKQDGVHYFEVQVREKF